MNMLLSIAACAALAASCDARASRGLADVTIIDRDSGVLLSPYVHRGEYWIAGRAGVFTIAHHRLIDSIRTQRTQTSLDSVGYEAESVVAQLTASPAAGPLGMAMAQDEAAALNRALRELPAEQREAFLLQVEGGLSVEDIADITGSSFETTKSRLRYARTKLRQLLEEPA